MLKKKFAEFLQPIDATHMRRVNRSVILELIRQNTPVARSEISRALGLSMPTVMRIVDELIHEGLVSETGETASSSGRPRQLLKFNKDGYAVIGVDLGGSKMYGALANIGGDIIGEVDRIRHASNGQDCYDQVVEMIQSLVDIPLKDHQQILGIAVGAPGVTHFKSGIIEWAPSLNWRDFPLKSRLEERFHLPVLVENDVNLAALGEQWFGAGKGVNNIVLITLGTGVGAGLIIDGMLYRGHTEAAGEVGYLIPDIHFLNKRYERFGALESVASGTAVAERAQALLNGEKNNTPPETLTTADVFGAAREGKEWACQIVAETIDYLSLAIANIATLLDPEVIILGGGLANSADQLIPPILERIEGVIQRQPHLEVSRLGSQATAMGAITLTIHATKDYYMVRRVY